MDADRFDAMARSLVALRTRRGMLGAVLGGTLGLLGLAETAADKRRNKKGGKGKKGKKGKKSPPTPCAETCSGCCDDDDCRLGTETAACGGGGEPCVDCADVGAGQTCGGGPGGTPGVCGCTPTTCAGEAKDCATIADGCGDELDCGTCPLAGQPCVDNVCGVCEEDCDGKGCGADDDCGGICTDGACPEGQTCGGGGTPGVCGNCTGDTDCDDGITCTNDVCVDGVCTHTPDHHFCRVSNSSFDWDCCPPHICCECPETSGTGCGCRCGHCGEGICCDCCFFFPPPDPLCV